MVASVNVYAQYVKSTKEDGNRILKAIRDTFAFLA
jgi:hypothetical protein